MEKRIRKLKNNLAVSGIGTIAFGIWSIVKATMYVFLNNEAIFADKAEYSNFVIAVCYIIMYLILGIDLLIRYKAGRAAIRMGRGSIARSARPVAEGIIVLIFSVVGIVFALASGSNQSDSLADVITSVVIELSSLLAVAEMVYSAIMLEHLQKKRNNASEV